MNALSSEKPLRLWPGVVGAIIVVFARFVIAPFVLGDALIGALAGLAGAALILLWWLFFSRAPWLERIGAVLLIALAAVMTLALVHPSIGGGTSGGMLFTFIASCDRPAIPGRGGHPVPAILASGSTDDDGGGDSPGQRNVGPRAHRRNRGAGQPAARLAMDADGGGEAAHCGPRRNAPVTGSANGAPTNGFIVGKRATDATASPRFPRSRAADR